MLCSFDKATSQPEVCKLQYSMSIESVEEDTGELTGSPGFASRSNGACGMYCDADEYKVQRYRRYLQFGY